jgi:hypothetical protein
MGSYGANRMSDLMFKQINLFGKEDADQTIYSKTIKAPTYEPNNKKPHLLELLDTAKTNQLIREIKDSSIGDEEKVFLIEAAKRHSVFNYEKIADYYAHSSPEMQHLIERSALVIIDFASAIRDGYVKLCDEMQSQYLEGNNEQ